MENTQFSTTVLQEMLAAKRFVGKNLLDFGRRVVEERRPAHTLNAYQTQLVLRYIVETSTSEEEILRRIKGEFNYPYTPIILSFTEVSDEDRLRFLVKGGLMTQNGILIGLMTLSPQNEELVM